MPSLACIEVQFSNNEPVRAMTYRVYQALIVSFGVIAVMLAASETFARPAATTRGAFTSAHSVSRPSILRTQRHHRLNNAGTFWPAVGDEFYGPSTGELPTADVAQPVSGDIHYTYDVPWDWAHRYPPVVTPSDRPYVPGCPTQTVTVPGHDGKRQAVNITQCF
jgi:hypothetical protein